MLSIICHKCAKTFDWEGPDHPGEVTLAQPHATGAHRVVVTCSFCQTDNTVWVINLPTDDIVEREEEEVTP